MPVQRHPNRKQGAATSYELRYQIAAHTFWAPALPFSIVILVQMPLAFFPFFLPVAALAALALRC